MFFRHRPTGDTPDHAGECRDRILRQPHGLADLAYGGARAVGDDGRGKPGPLAAVAGVDVLDHLLAPLVLEIDVDVGWLLALGRDEALEEDVDLGRVHRRDAEAEADGRVRGGTATLS